MKIPTFNKKNRSPDGSVLAPTTGSKKKKQPRRPATTAGNGTVVQSWASDAGKYLVYVLAAIVAVGSLCGFLAFNRPAPQIQKTVAAGITTDQQKAGAFAQTYLAAWLTATSTDHQALDQYAPTAGSNLVGTTATEYRDMAVASIENTEGNLVTVTVSATLKSATKDDKGKESITWTPYWYQVAVQNLNGKMAPAGLPSPISIPDMGSTPKLGYTQRIGNTEIQATVADFMTAYLTGQGDVTRYVSPETTITAITPAYWTEAKVRTIQSDTEVPDKTPAAGQSTEILVDMNLSRDTTTKPAQYALTLKVRDGRWEIQSLNSAPALAR